MTRPAIDRAPKPCTHKVANHQHGEYVTYVQDRCRCVPCADAAKAYERHRVRQQAYGRWDGYTDAGPARDHLTKLRTQGMGLRTVSKRSGLSESTLGKIIYGDPVRGRGPSKRIRPATEAKILAVTATVDDLADGAKIDGTGTRRRLQALVCIGWSQVRLAPLMGMTMANFNKMITGQRGKVEAGTARTARNLYDQLWATPPTLRSNYEAAGSRRAKRYALQRGWVPPLAWDDEMIDDPDTRPHSGNRVVSPRVDVDELVIEQWFDGHRVALSKAERVEVVRRLAARGHSDHQIADRLRVNTRTVLRDRAEHNIPSTWAAAS